METKAPYTIKTIHEFHRLRGLPKPDHPLISVVDYGSIHHTENSPISWRCDFYCISMKRNSGAKMRYGQQEYDFDEGLLFFMSPGQVFNVSVDHSARPEHSGWILLIHPDFLWKTPLAAAIKHYEYFDYAVNEALFLSEKEEVTLNGIVEHIRQEYSSNIDKFSQQIIIAHIETLLNYSERFYHRQFLTRKKANDQVLDQLDHLLEDYFSGAELKEKGLPTVQLISEQLNISPTYLRSLLKVLTGLNTQQHIHQKLIEKAKEQLSGTELSVGEIAYLLGFEHSQSFSKFFKSKTNVSPLAFRQSFS